MAAKSVMVRIVIEKTKEERRGIQEPKGQELTKNISKSQWARSQLGRPTPCLPRLLMPLLVQLLLLPPSFDGTDVLNLDFVLESLLTGPTRASLIQCIITVAAMEPMAIAAAVVASSTTDPSGSQQSFLLLGIWPLLDFIPITDDDPLFNLVWLFSFGFVVVSVRLGLNDLHGKKLKTKKNVKWKTHKKTKKFHDLSGILALTARRCGKRRVKKARLRHRHLSRRLACRWLRYKTTALARRNRTPTLFGQALRKQQSLVSPDEPAKESLDSPAYVSWLQRNCSVLAGGSAGSAKTRRLRREKGQATTSVASLVQLFKQFVNTSNGVDLSPIQSLLSGSTKKKKRKRRPQAHVVSEKASPAPSRNTKVWNGQLYDICPRTGWWSWIGPEAPQPRQVFQQTQKHWEEDWPKLPAAQSDRPVKSPSPAHSLPVKNIRISDWKASPVPQLCPARSALEALRSGQAMPGNLVELRTVDSLTEFEDCWQSYGCPGSMTLLLTGGLQHDSQHSTRISLSRGNQAQSLEKVGLVKLGSLPGPWTHDIQKVDLTAIPKVDKVSIRITAPQVYRDLFLPGDAKKDTAGLIVSTLASVSGVSTSVLLGGQWITRNQGQNSQLIGYVKVREEWLKKLLPHSGCQGIFLSKVHDRSGGKPWWIPKDPNESRDSYFARVAKLKQSRLQPMIWRNGGSSDLGFEARASDVAQNHARTFSLKGTPRTWDSFDLQEFLTGQGWGDISVSSKKNQTWFLRAKPPDSQVAQTSWDFQIMDDPPWNITMQTQVFRSKAKVNVYPARPPPRINDAKLDSATPVSRGVKATTKVAATQLESSQSQRERSRSPARDRKSATEGESSETMEVDAEKDACVSNSGVLHKAPPLDPDDAKVQGWEEHDFQGVGDCLFRCIAGFLAFNKGESPTAATTESQGAYWRAESVKHIRKHSARFYHVFAPKPNTTAATHPQTFEDWLKVASKKTTYANGVFLQSLAEKLGSVLVIWRKTDAGWERYTIAARFDSGGHACRSGDGHHIVIIQENEHFKLLKQPNDVQVPRAWLRETVSTLINLTGGARDSPGSRVSCPSVPPVFTEGSVVTPSVHTSCPTPSVHTVLSMKSGVPSHRLRCKTSVPSPHAASGKVGAGDCQQLVRGPSEASSVVRHGVSIQGPPTVQGMFFSSPANSYGPEAKSAPQNLGKTSETEGSYVQLPESISVWWTCSCGFQVLRHADLTCHVIRRKKHLNATHGIPWPELPIDPAAPDLNHAERKREEWLNRCGRWLKLAQQVGWDGMHALSPCRVAGRSGWQCQNCNNSWARWDRAVVSACSVGSAKPAKPVAKVPSPEAKLQLANQWWEQVQSEHARTLEASQAQLNSFSFLNNQERLSRRKRLPSPQKLFGGIPLVPSSDEGAMIWWSCSLCDFKVAKGSGASAKRKHHLQTVHNIENVPRLSQQGFSSVKRVQASQSSVQKRWRRRVEEFQKHPWPGSHDIESDPCDVTVSVCQSGKTNRFSRYRCKRCQRTVTAGDMAGSICMLHPERSKAPTLQRRVRLWKQCLRVATLTVTKGSTKDKCNPKRKAQPLRLKLSKEADGVRASRRGLRAVRVGEAKHPGPLQMASFNIASFRLHFNELCKVARKNSISVICLQETGITESQFPAVANLCRRSGWQIEIAPASSVQDGGRGGVAILAREPFALTKVHQVCDTWGQLVVCELLGFNSPLTVISGYRRPDGDWNTSEAELCAAFAKTRNRHWVYMADWNANPHKGPLPDFFTSVNGSLCGWSGHIRSTTPTDSVWASSSLPPRNHQNLDPISDHYGSLVKFDRCHAVPSPPAWEFKPVAPLLPDAVLPSEADSSVAWSKVAAPQEVWLDLLQRDIDECWHRWTADAEAYLCSIGAVQPRSGAVPRGQEPRLQPGVSKHGPGQCLSERQLRRFVRRLTEIQLHVHKGKVPPQNLQRACLRSCAVFGLTEEGRRHAWGRCLVLAKEKLDHVLRQSQYDALSNWRASVSSYEGACKWLRQKPPPPWTLESPDRISTGRAAGAAHLRDTWEEFFTGPAGYSPPVETFLQEFEPWIPSLPPLRLPELTVAALKSCVSSMKHKAAGTDGWTASALLLLPEACWKRLLDILDKVESSGRWPCALTHWRMTFLPKEQTQGSAGTNVLKVRPISIGALLYRAWSKLRFKQLSKDLSSALAPLQLGGLPGIGSESLLLSLTQETTPTTHPYGASLDFAKAFESVDWQVAVPLLIRSGVPMPIVRALEGAWAQQQRWVTYGSHVDCRKLEHVQSLLQGDPWSPFCMGLVLAGPAKRMTQENGGIHQTIYMDDRSATFADVPALRHFLFSWERVENLLRLKTNPSKSQFWGRTTEALADLLQAGFQAKDTMQVLGATLGCHGRGPSPMESQRQASAVLKARRISVLPVGMKLKCRLAATVLSPMASWGQGICGRFPNQSETKAFFSAYNLSVKTPNFPKGRACPELKKIFCLGHTCDLAFYSLLKTLRASFLWHASRARLGIQVQWSDKFAGTLADQLEPLGWTATTSGFQNDGQQCELGAPIETVDARLHDLRTSWRQLRFNQWLSKDRIDSTVATDNNLTISVDRLEGLRKDLRDVSAHAMAVACGGMMTPALNFERLQARQPPIASCPYCGANEIPGCLHVLWECSAFDDLRSLPAPACPLAKRLGWNLQGFLDKTILNQMAEIRQREARWRMKALHEQRRDHAA